MTSVFLLTSSIASNYHIMQAPCVTNMCAGNMVRSYPRDVLLVQSVLVLREANRAAQTDLITVHLSSGQITPYPFSNPILMCLHVRLIPQRWRKTSRAALGTAQSLTGSLLSELSNTTSTYADMTACPTPSW